MNVQPRLFLIAVTACGGMALAGCEKAPPPPAAPAIPAAAQAGPTPVIDSLGQVWVEMGSATPTETMYVHPIKAMLDIDPSAPKNAMATLTKWLEDHQQQMGKLDAISRQKLEALPENSGDLNEARKGPKFWLASMKWCLLADASRHYQNKDYTTAAARVATLLRFGAQLTSQGSSSSSLAGGSMLSQACGKLDAMVTAGGMNTVSGKDIREVLSHIDPKDPAGKIRSWSNDAKVQIVAYRAELTGSDAGAKLARQIEDYGVDGPEVTAMPKDGLDRMLAMVARKAGAERAKKLSSKQITKLLDQAEAMIAPISTALSNHDEAAITSLGNQLLADDTQVMRLVIGDGIGLLQVNQTFTDAVQKGIAAAAKMGP